MLPHDPIEHGPIQRVRAQMCGLVYIYFSDAHQVVCYQRLHDPFTKVFSEKTAYLRSSAPICKFNRSNRPAVFWAKASQVIDSVSRC